MKQDLILTGDLMLRRIEDPGRPFEKGPADVLFGNLEGCLYETERNYQAGVAMYKGTALDISQSPPTKSRRYDAGPAAASALTAAGYDAVGCANNVTYGEEAIPASIARLDDAGIAHTGAGSDRRSARAPAIVEKNGVRFGFLQYSCLYYPLWHEATEASPGIAVIKAYTAYQPHPRIMESPGEHASVVTWPDPGHLLSMRQDIGNLKDRVDIVVASYHWGLGGTHEPIRYQMEIGRAAVEAGADIVMGHGPHSVQAVEIYRENPIFYSLGDFISRSQRVGLAVRVGISDHRIIRITGYPTRPDAEGRPVVRSVTEEPETVETLKRVSQALGTELKEDGDSLLVWETP